MPEPAVNVQGWLPADFIRPSRLEVLAGHHLRLMSVQDADVLLAAVMGSQPRLWSVYGEDWGWPAATMTWEQNYHDLIRYVAEAEAHEAFSYALFDQKETHVLGCVYIDPPEYAGFDVDVSWWVATPLVGTSVERALNEAVPRWLSDDWPLRRPNFARNPEAAGGEGRRLD